LYPSPPVNNNCFIASITPRPVRLSKITLEDDPQTSADPLIFAVTAELEPGKKISNGVSRPNGYISKDLKTLLKNSALRLKGVNEDIARHRLTAIRRIMSNLKEDFPIKL